VAVKIYDNKLKVTIKQSIILKSAKILGMPILIMNELYEKLCVSFKRELTWLQRKDAVLFMEYYGQPIAEASESPGVIFLLNLDVFKEITSYIQTYND
jgi:hypothetical protein